MSEQSETPTGQHVPAASTLGDTPADVSATEAPPVEASPADASPADASAVDVQPTPAPGSSSGGPAGSSSGGPAGSSSSSPAAAVHDRPEIAVGAAFAGGFLLALILKRIAS